MTNPADIIVADAKEKLDRGFALVADMMADKYRVALSVQAPLVPGSMPPRAATLAEPGAFPRRVSGLLQSHVDSQQVGPAQWVFGIRGGVGYSLTLEYLLNHAFFNPILEEAMPEIVSGVSGFFQGGA